MPDDRWVAATPGKPSSSLNRGSDVDFARSFALIANALDDVTLPDGKSCTEDATLLLSTCRNAFMTVNALFEELTQLLGHGRELPPLEVALGKLLQNDTAAAKKSLDMVGNLLAQYHTKRKVWNLRHDLWQAFERRLAVLDTVSKDEIDLLLHSVRREDASRASDDKYLKINLDENPGVEEHFRALDIAAEKVQAVNNCAVSLARHLANEAETMRPQMKLPLSDEPARDQDESWGLVLRAFELCKQRFNGVPNLAISTTDHHASLSGQPEAHQGPATIITFLDNAIDDLYRSLCNSPFKPNVARSPLPRPFRLDLSAPEPTPEFLLSPVRPKTQSISGVSESPETVKIGLLDVLVPESLYDLEKLRYRLAVTADEIFRITKSAALAVGANGGQALILPECFVPESKSSEVQQLADAQQILVIGGVECRWNPNGKRENRVHVWIPGETAPFIQRKQRPSIYETNAKDFYCDGEARVFYNTPIGCFAIIICSDLQELDVLHALGESTKMPEIIIVPSMNPYPHVYKQLATATAYRMYSYVAMVNNPAITQPDSSAPNGVLFAPTKPGENPEISPDLTKPLEGTSSISTPLVRIFTLDLAGIRSRGHGKPSNFISPPHYRRHSS